jgi:outer membrane phospholipase A
VFERSIGCGVGSECNRDEPRFAIDAKSLFEGIVKKILIAILPVLLFAVNGAAGEIALQAHSLLSAEQADTSNQPQDKNNHGDTLSSGQRMQLPDSASTRKNSDGPVSAHKVNYCSMNHWPGDNNLQVKFQISMKFQVLEPNLYFFKSNILPVYVAYTQKSLWNVGQNSLPFEESNYNPELFIDYAVNAQVIGQIRLRDIVLCPLEHESNGLTDSLSRSWNRQYLMVKFALESKEKLAATNSNLSDKAALYVKLWQASGYAGQDAYLRSIGDNERFLDYMGRGEIGVSVRNFLWGGSLADHQLDIKTPILGDIRKSSFEFEFRQRLPKVNFAAYCQFWYGYGETLLRFDQFGKRYLFGFSFSY